MKKIISFSLYGNKPNFQVGAIVNVLEAKRLYEGWTCRFYTTDNDGICKQLEYLGAEIVRMDDWPEGQMFWRFLAVDDADVCLSRDADSVVNEREVGAVNEWLENTDCQWHAMHDHKHHQKVSIMGGMWGYRRYDGTPEERQKLAESGVYFFDFKNPETSMRNHIKNWLSKKDGNRKTTVGRNWDQIFLGHIYATGASTHLMWSGGWKNAKGNRFPLHYPVRYGGFVGDYSFRELSRWKGWAHGDMWLVAIIKKIINEGWTNEDDKKKRLMEAVKHIIAGCGGRIED